MERTPEQLAAQGAEAALLPAYLVAGPETLRVLEAADAIRAAARAQGVSEREVFDMEGKDADWSALESSFNAPSLFSPRRLIEVRIPTGKPNKEGNEILAGFCANPPNDVILLVTCGEWNYKNSGKGFEWSDGIKRIGAFAEAKQVKPHELHGWIEARLRSKGLRADSDAVQLLAERIEGNLLAAAQEIDKLALLAEGKTLDVEAMQSLVADAARYDVFRLIDVVLGGQATQVSHMLHGLRGEGENVAGLMPMIVRTLLQCAALARTQANGGNLGAEMKSQGIWESRQAPFKRALARHPDAQRWERFVAEASRIDRSAKGRGDGDPWLQLERLLLALSEAKATRLLVA